VSIPLTLYLDTTCWFRPFEDHTVQARIDEQNAITTILEQNENDSNEFGIVSCQMQLHQLYTKRNSLNTSEDEREVLDLIIVSLEEHAENTDNNPTGINNLIQPFIDATQLPDREDARHILTAWIRGAEYFITTDYSSILNYNSNGEIENYLSLQNHPILGTTGYTVKIRDPVSYVAEAGIS